MKKISILLALLLSLAGCGGGGGTSGNSSSSSGGGGTTTFPGLNEAPTVGSVGTAAVVDSLANICTAEGEKSWVRAHLDDVYLWYKEIANVAPSQYASVEDYFYALLVKSKDRFSFVSAQGQIDQFFEAGQEVGYGATFVNQSSRFRVAYAQPNSPAEQQKVTRGVQIIGINGVPIGQVSAAAQIAALYPTKAGASNQFEVLDVGATSTRLVQMTAAAITRAPVLKTSIVTTADQKKIGYMAFTDHIATAEQPLINAMNEFKKGAIDDLVLDVRYNGGGYLYIASEVGQMIGGTAVQNKVFEKLQFNDRHPEKTNNPGSTFPFFDTSTQNQTLPQLNLKRVFVLTGPGTCSASEAIINGLSPFVKVITIGGTTCGKPYGFIQKNNCGKAYFAIEFVGVNAAGEGNYSNGFTPVCPASDDLEHQLGDTSERLLLGAINYSKSGVCPAVSLTQAAGGNFVPETAKEVYRAPWREIRR